MFLNYCKYLYYMTGNCYVEAAVTCWPFFHFINSTARTRQEHISSNFIVFHSHQQNRTIRFTEIVRCNFLMAKYWRVCFIMTSIAAASAVLIGPLCTIPPDRTTCLSYNVGVSALNVSLEVRRQDWAELRGPTGPLQKFILLFWFLVLLSCSITQLPLSFRLLQEPHLHYRVRCLNKSGNFTLHSIMASPHQGPRNMMVLFLLWDHVFIIVLVYSC